MKQIRIRKSRGDELTVTLRGKPADVINALTYGAPLRMLQTMQRELEREMKRRQKK